MQCLKTMCQKCSISCHICPNKLYHKKCFEMVKWHCISCQTIFCDLDYNKIGSICGGCKVGILCVNCKDSSLKYCNECE